MASTAFSFGTDHWIAKEFMQQEHQSNNTSSHIIDNTRTDYSLTRTASSRPKGPGGREIFKATARSNHTSAPPPYLHARPTLSPAVIRASNDVLTKFRSPRPARTRSTLAAEISASPSPSTEPPAIPLPRSVRDAQEQQQNGASNKTLLPTIISTTGSSARTLAPLLNDPKLLRPGPPTLHHHHHDDSPSSSSNMYKLQQVNYAASADPRGFTPIWEYALPTDGKAVIMVDADDSYVHFTGIWKAAGFGRSAEITRLIEQFPELDKAIRKVRGGLTKIQGVWFPFELSRRFARRFAWKIREHLIPIFGPAFPAWCIPPEEDGFADLAAEMQLISEEVRDARVSPGATTTATRNGSGRRPDRTATPESTKVACRQKSLAVRTLDSPGPTLPLQSNSDHGLRTKSPLDASHMLSDAAQSFLETPSTPAPAAAAATRSASRNRRASSSAADVLGTPAPSTSSRDRIRKRKRQTSMPVHHHYQRARTRTSESPQEMKERRKAEMVVYQAELQGAINYLHQSRRFVPPSGLGAVGGGGGFSASSMASVQQAPVVAERERAMRYSPLLTTSETYSPAAATTTTTTTTPTRFRSFSAQEAAEHHHHLASWSPIEPRTTACRSTTVSD